MKKTGFTLGEVAITVAIIGFLAATFLPVIKNAMPNQEQLMFKKAYYLTERLVAEMVNDEELYPEVEETDAKQFFGNTVGVRYRGKEYTGGDTKFCELMAAKINNSSEPSCTAQTKFADNTKPTGTLTTADGMVWILPISSFADETTAQEIYIDVNGMKKPNCFYNTTSCKRPDRFTIKVYQDGRVEADGTMEIEYLNKVNISKDAEAETEQARKDAGLDKE